MQDSSRELTEHVRAVPNIWGPLQIVAASNFHGCHGREYKVVKERVERLNKLKIAHFAHRF